MPSTRAQSRVMRAQLDNMPLELLRLVINFTSTSRFDKQIMRTNLSMVDKRIRAILAPDMREVAWFSPLQLESVPLDEDSVASLEVAWILVVSSPPCQPGTDEYGDEICASNAPTVWTDEYAIARVLNRFRRVKHLFLLGPPVCAWRFRFCFEVSFSNPVRGESDLCRPSCGVY